MGIGALSDAARLSTWKGSELEKLSAEPGCAKLCVGEPFEVSRNSVSQRL
jgi:hypothetical protein